MTSAAITPGRQLADRLNLNITGREGHDLRGPCIASNSSDAFRLHEERGVAQCYACNGAWSSFQLAEQVLGNRLQAIDLMVELGFFRANSNATGGNGRAGSNANPPRPTAADAEVSPQDLIAAVEQEKGIPPGGLLHYGARVTPDGRVAEPQFSPEGTRCS